MIYRVARYDPSSRVIKKSHVQYANTNCARCLSFLAEIRPDLLVGLEVAISGLSHYIA